MNTCLFIELGFTRDDAILIAPFIVATIKAEGVPGVLYPRRYRRDWFLRKLLEFSRGWNGGNSMPSMTAGPEKAPVPKQPIGALRANCPPPNLSRLEVEKALAKGETWPNQPRPERQRGVMAYAQLQNHSTVDSLAGTAFILPAVSATDALGA